jgi:hypothetical protein
MKTNRTLIGAVALVSFFGLCGAKAQGCGGTVETEPAPAPCAQGYHIENVCQDDCYVSSSADSSSGSGDCQQTCADQCVPDSACPDGTIEQTVCAEPLSSGSGGSGCASDSADTGCYEPPQPGDCWTECVPIDPCGAGFHQEWSCGPTPTPVSDPSPSNPPSGSAEPSPPPDDCVLICVPDICPPGTIEQTICDDPVSSSTDCLDGDCPPPPDPSNCWTECVPVDPCGPGYHEETTCTVSAGDSGAGAGPGTEECTTTCVPDQCPPDSVLVEVCDPVTEGSPPNCWMECQPVEPPSAS